MPVTEFLAVLAIVPVLAKGVADAAEAIESSYDRVVAVLRRVSQSQHQSNSNDPALEPLLDQQSSPDQEPTVVQDLPAGDEDFKNAVLALLNWCRRHVLRIVAWVRGSIKITFLANDKFDIHLAKGELQVILENLLKNQLLDNELCLSLCLEISQHPNEITPTNLPPLSAMTKGDEMTTIENNSHSEVKDIQEESSFVIQTAIIDNDDDGGEYVRTDVCSGITIISSKYDASTHEASPVEVTGEKIKEMTLKGEETMPSASVSAKENIHATPPRPTTPASPSHIYSSSSKKIATLPNSLSPRSPQFISDSSSERVVILVLNFQTQNCLSTEAFQSTGIVDTPTHRASILRGLHDIFHYNLGFETTDSSSCLIAAENTLCEKLGISTGLSRQDVLFHLRVRIDLLIRFGLNSKKPYMDYRRACHWLATVAQMTNDPSQMSARVGPAPLLLYYGTREEVFFPKIVYDNSPLR